MLSSKDRQQHLSHAQLHTFVRGELDPARRKVVEAHLQACEACARLLAQVEGVTGLFDDMNQGGIDDLRWRRIREAVRSQLDADARQPLTADLMSGRRWVLPSMAAAAVVGAMVWGAMTPRSKEPEPTTGSTAAAAPLAAPPDEQRLSSGGAPLAVTLNSGARLELEPHTVVRAVQPNSPRLDLELSQGALRVRLPTVPTPDLAARLKSPAFELFAQSDDFSAAFWADRYSIDVHTGLVRVSGADFGTGAVIAAGQSRGVKTSGPRPAPKTVRQPERRSKPAAAKPPAPKPPAPKRIAAVPATKPSRPKSPEAARPIVSTSYTGTVTVEVEAPARTAAATLWRRANDAYYRRRDLDETVRLAQQIIDLDGPEAMPARQLLCDAYIAQGDGPAALTACRRLLLDTTSAEERRNIHYTVGTIYRTLLGDCAHAIEQYNRALVFGRQHFLDDEVRIFRATCALEVGDADLAERDVASLSARAGRLARPEEVKRLQRQLEAVKRRAHGDAVTTD